MTARDRLARGLEAALAAPLRHLPTPLVGAIAAALGQSAAPRLYPQLDAQLRATLATLRPDLPQEAARREVWDNLARTFCEIPGALRLKPERRIEVVGAEHVLHTQRDRPVLIAGLHTANPEVLGLTLAWIGARPVGVAARQPTALRDRIVTRLRLEAGGRLLTADRDAVRPALRVLRGREGALMFWMDDYRDGVVHGPSLGRGPRTVGNIPYAVRLARLTGCAIVPGYVLRLPGTRFRTHFLPPVELPGGDIAAGAAALDAVLDPIVRAHLTQWFFAIAWRPDR